MKGFLLKLMSFIFISPEDAADTAIFLASAGEVSGVSGKYFIKRKTVEPKAAAHDPAIQATVMKIGERLTGHKY
jgi:retinol dehydrogenase 14